MLMLQHCIDLDLILFLFFSYLKMEDMKWTFENIDLHLKDLTVEIRQKAKEIAEELKTKENYTEERAVKEAIKRAQEWLFDSEG